MTEKSLLFRIEKAKLRATEAIRSNKLSGKENAALMAEVAIDAALPVLLAPRVTPRVERSDRVRVVADAIEDCCTHGALFYTCAACSVFDAARAVLAALDDASTDEAPAELRDEPDSQARADLGSPPASSVDDVPNLPTESSLIHAGRELAALLEYVVQYDAPPHLDTVRQALDVWQRLADSAGAGDGS